MVKYEYINGLKVEFESEDRHIKDGLNYLDDKIQTEEAKVFFKQAKEKKSAQFEDTQNHQFTLMYKGSDVYVLISRS